ncbi:hypothetical protein ACFXTI_014456 [Malus domestica]
MTIGRGCRRQSRPQKLFVLSGRNLGSELLRLIQTRPGVKTLCVWGWVGWVGILLDCSKRLGGLALDSVIVPLLLKLLPSGMLYWPVSIMGLMTSSLNLMQV